MPPVPMDQVLEVLMTPKQLEAFEPRWLHVLVEAGKEHLLDSDWAGQVTAMSNEVGEPGIEVEVGLKRLDL